LLTDQLHKLSPRGTYSVPPSCEHPPPSRNASRYLEETQSGRLDWTQMLLACVGSKRPKCNGPQKDEPA
jgi:hypothetical protein